LARSVFNLYEKPEFPAEKKVIESSFSRSMMNQYIENEQNVQAPSQRLDRSMFNLSEKVEIPAKVEQPAANSYDRSMMSLFEKNQV
jgi:hypothetical protein